MKYPKKKDIKTNKINKFALKKVQIAERTVIETRRKSKIKKRGVQKSPFVKSLDLSIAEKGLSLSLRESMEQKIVFTPR
ncbi:MAG: hypothetical protein RAK22_01025 [Nanoarchaeota archaeon]|nr:hypothetical protein [Nanoarchaeota archaeon]